MRASTITITITHYNYFCCCDFTASYLKNPFNPLSLVCASDCMCWCWCQVNYIFINIFLFSLFGYYSEKFNLALTFSARKWNSMQHFLYSLKVKKQQRETLCALHRSRISSYMCFENYKPDWWTWCFSYSKSLLDLLFFLKKKSIALRAKFLSWDKCHKNPYIHCELNIKSTQFNWTELIKLAT